MRKACYAVVLALLSLGWQAGADATTGDTANQASAAGDLSRVPDGTYVGSYSSFPVAATVEITVVDHAITAFAVKKHRCGRGRPAEAITGRVMERQTLSVDVVSGATASSRVILKAAENALSTAKEGSR